MNRNGSSIELREMTELDVAAAGRLIASAMNKDEAVWATQTMQFHFTCKANGLDDGRDYFVYSPNRRLAGLVGLHHYQWGPAENVWLAWFAVDPDRQRQGIGRRLLEAAERLAVGKGYRKLFVETYNSPEFNKARKFYRTNGFVKAGEIDQYLPDGHSMVVFVKTLMG